MTTDNILEIRNLSKVFPVRNGFSYSTAAGVKAVNDVSFSIKRGETLGLVGESGCGKTTLARCILRLLEPTSGEIIFNGQDITKLSDSQMRNLRKKMQIIFQDPYASLNPRMTVGTILQEPMEIHNLAVNKAERIKKLNTLLDQVQLPRDALNKYPHEFSGGQRQRIAIARALAVEPEFIICDEPVSALDVSIQAQIINLLVDLQKELKLTYLFVAHDLKVVEYISQNVAVMYLGKIIEQANSSELFQNAKHPYTKALFSAIPYPDINRHKERIVLSGELPSPINPPAGCHFHPRCYRDIEQCSAQYPSQTHLNDSHSYCCFNPF